MNEIFIIENMIDTEKYIMIEYCIMNENLKNEYSNDIEQNTIIVEKFYTNENLKIENMMDYELYTTIIEI